MSKIAVITGGAQGIGLGMVRHFLEKKWRVAALDVDEEARNGCFSFRSGCRIHYGQSFVVDGGMTRKMVYEPQRVKRHGFFGCRVTVRMTAFRQAE